MFFYGVHYHGTFLLYKDNTNFNEFGKLPENAILVSTDVVGLYSSIPHADGLEALSTKLEQ